MYYEQRKPDFLITILRPDYTSSGDYREETVDTFTADESNKMLVSYQYSQSVESFDAPFSLSFVPYLVNDRGETMIDRVKLLDLVRIEEQGEVKYLGVVESVRYSARMTGNGPDRSIVVQGYGVGGVLDRFSMLLDQVILAEAKVSVKALQDNVQALMANLSAKYKENTSMYHVFQVIRDSFKEAMEKVGGFSKNTGMFRLVDQYLQFSEDSKLLKTKYPVALSVFSYGEISLGQAWQTLVTRPFYEFFPRWDESAEKWLIILRPTPYSPEGWLKKLKRTVIDPLHVEYFDCGYSTQDVKTWFFSYLSGGAISYDKARAMYQETAIKKDSSKWLLYGYRPLECAFRYVDMDLLNKNKRQITLSSARPGDPNKKAETVNDDILMKEYTERIYSWFRRADEMLTGGITMMTVKGGPRIGERAVFNETEFYVESVSGSWQYGGKMTTQLSLTRGGVYNESFNVSSDESETNWWFKKAGKLGNRLELKKE